MWAGLCSFLGFWGENLFQLLASTCIPWFLTSSFIVKASKQAVSVSSD